MRRTLSQWTWKSVIYLGIAMIWTALALGQANFSAGRRAEIRTFGQMTYLQPDWGTTSNLGYSAGVDYTRFVPLIIQPSLEIRMTHAGGDTVGESSYAGGVKLATTIHNVHPYVDMLEGLGKITFTHPTLTPGKGFYTHDESRIYSVGGGAEFDVQSLWQMRIDVAQQYWDLKPPALSPMAISVGLSYRIPFRDGKIK